MFAVYQAELALKVALLGVMNAYSAEGIEFTAVTATAETTPDDVVFFVQSTHGEVVTREASH